MALVTAACSSGDDEEAGAGGVASASGECAGPIQITVMADVTGKAAFFGEAIKDGAEFTVDFLNESGGIGGEPIELTIEDTTSDVGRATTQINDAARGETDAVIFGVLSEEALAIGPLAQEAGLPLVNIQAAADGVLDAGDYMWRITPPQRNFYDNFVEYLSANREVESTAIFYVTDNEASRALGEDIGPPAFKKAGIEVTEAVSTTSSETDLTTVADRGLRGNPDHVQLHLIGAQNISMITALRRAGFEGSIGSGTSLGAGALSALPGNEADGILYYSSFVGSEELPHESGVEFTQAFQEATGEQPNTFHAETYDAFRLIQDAVEATGSTCREDIKAGMEQVAEEGLTGAQGDPITFEERDARTSGVVIEWMGGQETLAPGQE
jgi:branched-chain amino acid transport system substrate-binding protein